MERKISGKANDLTSDSSDGSATTSTTRSDSSSPKPNYASKAVVEALQHLASIDLIELCNEAKVEQCRATRDLRSCGRYVRHKLHLCGHASLCEECSHRYDICPICRIPLPTNENRLRLRLYNECLDARLISKKSDERFQEREDGEKQLNDDVERLYTFFDVAMENNLVSLICHYITDVCMDETAVSSNPVIAFLLDEVVVKNWCKRTFRNIISEVQRIYSLQIQDMKKKLTVLLKFSIQLTGICNVLEVLVSSLKGALSAALDDVHDLQESVLKAKQHMEIMMWCVRHEFLENVLSRHTSLTSWRSLVSARKAAAIKRAWPDSINTSSELSVKNGSLFIEDALLNLEIEQAGTPQTEEEILFASLHEDGASSVFRSKIEGVSGTYPFQNVRTAIDILFLHGSSDLVVAKRAILLYYLFDRHWTLPNENWRHIVDDFAATFCITRHSLLESLTFYLLDDHMDNAMQEACRLLPEIASPGTHPKVAQVLLERQNPDSALMVLRWSGRDGGVVLGSLPEAVTGVRVRVESGLLTEAFMYQRMLCMKVKDKNVKHGFIRNSSNGPNNELESWVSWIDALVTEVCYLCIRRNLVDRMVDLPWNSDEEKYLHKSLLDYAIENPSTTVGSLLVVFYLKRYRYIEAFQTDRILKDVEQDLISKDSVGEEVLSRMRSASYWRAGLVDKCIELLPEVQQQQLKTGKLPEFGTSIGDDVNMPCIPDLSSLQEQSTSLLIPSSNDSSVILRLGHTSPSFKFPGSENPFSQCGLVNDSYLDISKDTSAPVRLFPIAERGHMPQKSIGKNFKFDDLSTPGNRQASPIAASALKEFNRSSSRMMKNSHLQDKSPDEASPELQVDGFIRQLQNISTPYSRRMTDSISNKATTPAKPRLFNDSTPDKYSKLSDRLTPFDRQPWAVASTNDPMDASVSNKDKSFGGVEAKANGALRWRSDESDDDEEQTPGRIHQVASQATPMSGIRRRRRFA